MIHFTKECKLIVDNGDIYFSQRYAMNVGLSGRDIFESLEISLLDVGYSLIYSSLPLQQRFLGFQRMMSKHTNTRITC